MGADDICIVGEIETVQWCEFVLLCVCGHKDDALPYIMVAVCPRPSEERGRSEVVVARACSLFIGHENADQICFQTDAYVTIALVFVGFVGRSWALAGITFWGRRFQIRFIFHLPR